MARIPDEQINRLKQDVSLLRLVESQGHRPQKQGKDYAICCPFHAGDDTPSLIISPRSNLYHCFGCGAAGSVIDWVMKTRGVSFRFACELLQQDLGLVAEADQAPLKKNTATKLPPPLAADADSQTALRQVIDYYHETFKQSPEVQVYLRSRGLEHPELIERFKLGFANRTLGYRLPEKNRKAGAELRGKLQEIGILRDSGHEHFNGSLVVPVLDENGIIREVYGRKIQGNKLRKGTAQHLYLPGPHEGVWNIEAFTGTDEIILCEALIDAMTFWVHGFRNVTASYGTSGFTASHLAAFKNHQIKRVLIAYDRDDAGNKAAEQLAEKLQKEGIDCYRVLLPKGMDVNDYALTTTPAAKALGLVIRKAEWMGQGQAPGRSSASMHSRHTVHPEHKRQLAIEHMTGNPAQSALPEPASPLAADSAAPVPEPTQASPVPAMPGVEIEAEISEHEIKLPLGPRQYRVRGLPKNLSYEHLKINLLVSQGESVHVDQLDLYHAKARYSFIKQAAIELGVKDEAIKQDLGKVLLKLEALQDEQIKNTLENQPEKAPALSDEEQQAALDYLRDPSLLSRLLADFNACGVVGEETNKLAGYLACVSRKLDKPLAVIIQSSSAAGKSSLMDAILNLMPEEERIQYSAMTGQSLFYMGETNLKHKILAIAEEEGAHNASYALKLLQSDGAVSIASTGKNDVTGNLETKTYTVQGPVMLFLTTTAIDIDEELLNRCVVLSVNESREQTDAIHALQRDGQTLEGLVLQAERQRLLTLHRNAQRLLRPVKVVNPYARQLTFNSSQTRSRRDHMKYLQLINSIALLHQYQREVKTVMHQDQMIEYIEVTLNDIAVANQLAHDVLGRSLDELPPQTRKLLTLIHAQVTRACKDEATKQSDYRFTRKDVRAVCGWSDMQVKRHMQRLQDLEYVLMHKGGRGVSIVYELLYQGEGTEGHRFLMGLADVASLQYDGEKGALNGQKGGPGSGQVRPKIGVGSGAENPLESSKTPLKTASNEQRAEQAENNTSLANQNNSESYRNHSPALAAQGAN